MQKEQKKSFGKKRQQQRQLTAKALEEFNTRSKLINPKLNFIFNSRLVVLQNNSNGGALSSLWCTETIVRM